MVRMKVFDSGFARLRTLTEALQLPEGDRRTVVLRLLDGVHREQARQAFTSKGATTGSTWAPLSPKYAAWKRRAGHGTRPLRMNRAYRGRSPEQLFRAHTLAGRGHIARWIGGWKFEFGVKGDPVASYHEEGTGSMPRRSVLQKTAAQLQEFGDALARYWIERMRQSTKHQR